jgi:hypothetical protein
MNPSRLRAGEVIAAIGGLALFGVMFLSWYEVTGGGGRSAWEAFSVIDIILLLTILSTLLLAAVTMAHRDTAVPIAVSVLTFTLGLIALVLVVIRLIDVPTDGLSTDIGIWLGLACVLAIAAGGLIAMRDEHLAPDERLADLPVRPAPPPGGSPGHPEPGSSGA